MSTRPKLETGPIRTPVLEYRLRRGWEAWLARNHSRSRGVWLHLYRGNPAKPSMTYVEALHGALCYGWMEGRKKLKDQQSWLQQFKPRSPSSRWSRLHAENAERLIKAGRMKAPGLREIRAAKADGRWRLAYDPPGSAKVPAELLEALAKNLAAQAAFKALSRADTYAVAYRLQAARDPRIRAQRLRAILGLLAKGIRPLR